MPFQCPVCHRCYAQKSVLRKHLLVHTGERPYQCSVCNKSFNQKTSLRNHMRIHTGEKPFQCLVCSKCFIQKAHLRTHYYTQHKSAECSATSLDAQSHKMNYQSSGGGGDEQFQSQKKSKKIHQCPYCPYSSINGCHVRDHIFRHTGQKPHQCHICHKQSRTKSDLKKHF
ncbi:hypothetical protein CEXT_473021 [Caerostris extrusa]|uniref:C2H2-type domain-containing protein n=1 Tax=Caerostris extrusa TaxID=172846 RepID=A0AAV4UBX6_CAEEX|nr:hypothetical protein CEXT_473021 [Caerostris extrusa]